MINQLNTELVEISQRLSSLTVEIVNYRGGGSGFIWSADGLIITNAHVVRGSKVSIKLADETIVAGSVIVRDDRTDLAAIKIQAKNLPTPVVRKSVRPGEIVLAMGSPWGFKGTLTQGIVHTTHWQVDRASAVIVADLRLAPGNSGGILADAEGKVIGINTAIYNGLALAIPTQQIQDFVEPL